MAQTPYPECTDCTFNEPHQLYGKGQTISGRIKGFFGGNVKKGPICILAPKQNIIATTTTDEKGEFIVNTSFRDSTTFLVQARTKRGFAGVDIVIDTPQYPIASHKSPFHDGTATFMEDYLLNTRDQYYMEGGMRVYNLKEVVVTGSRKGQFRKYLHRRYQHLHDRGGQTGRIRCTNSF